VIPEVPPRWPGETFVCIGGGPSLTVQGAGVDCQKGRYQQGIRELEKVLRGQGYTVPPPGSDLTSRWPS